MQIAIIAGGSRGDVQPYVALGKGLQKAGHTVRILSSDDFHNLVMDSGLDFFDRVTPFFVDQPFWGQRVYELGVGPKPIRQRSLNVDNLTEAIGQAVSDVEMRKKAALLGQRIRAENGVAQVVAAIEQRRR